MNKMDFEKALKDYIRTSPENFIQVDNALRPELVGMRIFDEPLVGYASASDPYFTEAKKPHIIGAHFMAPDEWLAGAKTVVCMFLPLTEQIRKANRQNMAWPADEWLHGRIEGQGFISSICRFALELLKKEGIPAVVPSLDPRFSHTNPLPTEKTEQSFYTSNWSERHAAYASGLGTFSLSKGLITTKGVAGRYLSIILPLQFEADTRPYSGIYDYCSDCGLCASNCPAGAISKEQGKNHYLCSQFIDLVREKHNPRYGCGKCQVNVPCEDKAPKAASWSTILSSDKHTT